MLNKQREQNRISSKKHRAKDSWKKYFSEYFKEWIKNPINYKCHRTRTMIANIKTCLKRNCNHQFREKYTQILENLLTIGWNCDLPIDKCLNHKVSLNILFTFNVDLPYEVVSSVENLEITDKLKNNSVIKRKVTLKTVATAKRLEKKFPEYLTGLSAYVSSRVGEII